MAVVPFFNMKEIRATMEKNQHLLDKADECFKKHNLEGALNYRFEFYKPLGAYPFVSGMSGGFWSICGAAVSRYGNDAAYAMIWNADWCGKEDDGQSRGPGLSDVYGEINREYEKEGFVNIYGGGMRQYLIEDHRNIHDYHRSEWIDQPTGWTADGAGLWHGSQTGNELMRPIELYESDELGGHKIHVFAKMDAVRAILTIHSEEDAARWNMLWNFWSEDYGPISSPTPLDEVAKNGYFVAEIRLRGGTFMALCSNERIVATLKDYLEGGVTKVREDRGRITILDAKAAEGVYARHGIPRYTLKHVSTIQ